jgi:hypothetical protein
MAKSLADAFGLWAFEIGQTASQSPRQNGHSKRLNGSTRRECFDHVAVIGERQLKHLLLSYMHYYNGARTHHLSPGEDAPVRRAIQAI